MFSFIFSSTNGDNKTQGEGIKKKSNLTNVEDSSCSSNNNNIASNTQIGASSIPEATEATVKSPSTVNTANKITTEGEAFSTTATTNTIEPKPISVTVTTKIDKTSTAPKATADRPLSSTEANTKIVETPAPNATSNQLKPSSSTETKVDKTPTAPKATTDKSEPLSSTETKDKKPEAEGILDTEVSFDKSIQLNELEDTYRNFLREEFIFPNVNREAFHAAGLSIERGLIIHGSSHRIVDLVNAFANELSRIYGKQTRMFTRTPQDMFRANLDDQDKFMKRIINSVEKCAKDTPIIIFVQDLRSFFQICSILKRAESSAVVTLSTLFRTYLGNSSKYSRLFVIGAVDDFGVIPTILIGTGMFAKSLAISQSTTHAGPAGRMIHLKESVRKWSVQPNDKLLQEIAEKTDGFTPLQLHELAQSVYKVSFCC